MADGTYRWGIPLAQQAVRDLDHLRAADCYVLADCYGAAATFYRDQADAADPQDPHRRLYRQLASKYTMLLGRWWARGAAIERGEAFRTFPRGYRVHSRREVVSQAR